MKLSLNKYGYELICKLKQIAIYKNIKRLRRKRLFYLVYPLLKKILMKKGLYFHIWNQRSKYINVSNPIKPIKSFFQFIKRKMSFGKEGRLRTFSHKMTQHVKRVFFNGFKDEIKRKSLIYVAFILRKALKRNLPTVLSVFRKCFSVDSRQLHSKRKVLHRKDNNSIDERDNNIAVETNINQQRLYNSSSSNKGREKANIDWLVQYTVLKLNIIKWKRQAKAVKYKSSSVSQGRNKMNNLIKADNNIAPIASRYKSSQRNPSDIVNQQSFDDGNDQQQENDPERDMIYSTKEKHLMINQSPTTSALNNKAQFDKVIKSKILLAEAKKVNRKFFAFVKWTLLSKFDQLTKEKMKVLYNNFQQSYLQAVKEMEEMEYSMIDDSDQMNLLNYTFTIFRNKIDRSINSSFGKLLLFK